MAAAAAVGEGVVSEELNLARLLAASEYGEEEHGEACC